MRSACFHPTQDVALFKLWKIAESRLLEVVSCIILASLGVNNVSFLGEKWQRPKIFHKDLTRILLYLYS